MDLINVGILGYGNLGRSVEIAVKQSKDMTLTGVYTRRNPLDVQPIFDDTKVFSAEKLEIPQSIDVLILCGGSSADLPWQTPKYVQHYNVIDSYDHHAMIPKHFAAVDQVATAANHVALISCGWDPGLFSLVRYLLTAILPEESVYTFWGKGISQGHSDAIRRIDGVADARQYTIPLESAVNHIMNGEKPHLDAKEMHKRECYVVAEEQADFKRIEAEIKAMPDYFDGYDTFVYFVSQNELNQQHSSFPHGGTIIMAGATGLEQEECVMASFQLKLESNPAFTAKIMTAYARAVYQLSKEAQFGCKTIYDIPISYLNLERFREL